jgi:hypothetical protein
MFLYNTLTKQVNSDGEVSDLYSGVAVYARDGSWRSLIIRISHN